ncbi:hypothetical protein QUA31_28075, partial [Microcoleus sp. Pol14D5]|uniref:hypothetical protein n=1 Tax=Microcoleus sp. Pol12A4 TaxID=3055391 RepID=UPI002FD46BAD
HQTSPFNEPSESDHGLERERFLRVSTSERFTVLIWLEASRSRTCSQPPSTSIIASTANASNM